MKHTSQGKTIRTYDAISTDNVRKLRDDIRTLQVASAKLVFGRVGRRSRGPKHMYPRVGWADCSCTGQLGWDLVNIKWATRSKLWETFHTER